MTFTYDLDTPTDLTRIRYHTADTVADAVIHSDEEINFVVSEEGTWQKAVISLIKDIIAKLSHQPDMTADWLKIDLRRSSEYWVKLLAEKRAELGVAASTSRTGSTVATYRSDSLQTEAPDW